MAMSEIAVLRQFVKHIPENESLSLKIFSDGWGGKSPSGFFLQFFQTV